MMTGADYELIFLEAGIDQLENYLLSNDIYRPIGVREKSGSPPYPQLTLGLLLLSRLRARAVSQTIAQKTELQSLETGMDAIHAKWRTAWNNKAEAEFRARINLWRDFLEEFRANPQGNIDRYPYEVTRRVLLHLLREQIFELPTADLEALTGLDRILNALFIPGEFIWDPELSSSFPQSTFWYLYGMPEAGEGAADKP